MKFIEVLLTWCVLLSVVIIRDTWGVKVNVTLLFILVSLAIGATAYYCWIVYVEVQASKEILRRL